MGLDLAEYDLQAREAVKLFWSKRTHGAVTTGKNMDGFMALIRSIVKANGLPDTDICMQRQVLTLPGFFRPTKLWDMLVMHRGQLIAAVEFKSQAGPSFGNNFNNRCEEAIGSAHDFWKAYRDGAFGSEALRPFLGWIILVEDCEASRSPVLCSEPHFPVLGEFKRTSYAERYNILCRRLVQEGLYTQSGLLLSSRTAAKNGTYSHLSELTSLRTFVLGLAGHIAAVAAD